MTKECHENFLQKCMEPWAPPNSKLTPIIGGHFFGGSSTWKCVPECNPKKGITTNCGPKCKEKQAKIDEAGIAGGEISPIAGMCRKWAFIQPRVFNETVAPEICKLPDKKYIDGMLDKLQNKDNKVINKKDLIIKTKIAPSDKEKKDKDVEAELSLHEKMYRLATEKHNPWGSEGFHTGVQYD